jgi:O-antigen/teichoic acid export membrane protein
LQVIRLRPAAIVNVLLRCLTLFFRFLLILYIARYIGVEAVAVYGFIISLVAIYIAVSSIGLKPQFERELVTLSRQDALLALRESITIRLGLSAMIASLSMLIVPKVSGLNYSATAGVLTILIGEACFFDYQRALLSRHKAVLSNFIYSARSSLWVPITVVMGLYDPYYRAISFVLYCWILSLIISTVLVAMSLKRSDVKYLVKSPKSVQFYGLNLKGFLFFVCNVGFVAAFYIDRFLIDIIVGQYEAGIFVFIWSVINAAASVVQVAFIQTSVASFSMAWEIRGPSFWRYVVAFEARTVFLVSILLGSGSFIALTVLLPLAGYRYGYDYALLAALLTAAAIIRLVGDVFHQGIYSAEKDTAWLAINLGMVLLSPVLGAALIYGWGINGAGYLALSASCLLLGLRFHVYRMAYRP